MKMNEVIELSNLYETIKDIKMPLKTSYKFSRLMRQVQTEIEFYQTKFKELVDEYAERDNNGEYIYSDDGQSISIIKGKEQECNEKIAELQNLDVDIKDISFSFDELETLENLNLSVAQMSCLIPLIKE